MASRQKGKIPHSEWAAIASRHEAGESLASIARAYSCTAPAIRYIVTRGNAARSGSVARRGPASPANPTPPRAEAATNSLQRQQAGRPAREEPRGSGSLDPTLREKISAEIAAFLVAFDSSLGAPSTGRLEELRDATDSLMRAAARIRIELERVLVRKERSAA